MTKILYYNAGTALETKLTILKNRAQVANKDLEDFENININAHDLWDIIKNIHILATHQNLMERKIHICDKKNSYMQ